jgi:hypothetical protein
MRPFLFMPLTRSHSWERELHSFLSSRIALPFAYRTNDCSVFACDGIQAMTGVDIAEDFRVIRYATAIGALRAIRKVTGGSTVEDAAAYCADKYSLPELTHPLLAKRGDLVLIEQSAGNLVMGLVHMTGSYVVAPGDPGLLRLPLTAIKKAWSI